MGGVRPPYRLGARLYTRYILRQDPNARICILHEDSDFGRDYTAGARDVLGDKYAATVREAVYEFTDASIERQIVELKSTGCNALIATTLPSLAVQAIRKVNDLGWKPIFFMNTISASVPLSCSWPGSRAASDCYHRRISRTRLILRSRMTRG